MPTLRKSTLDSANRKPRSLDNHLDKRLLTYLATAGAAGVGVLAMAQPANAKVVYTPANQAISFDGMHIDINNDGIPDYGFHSYGLGNIGSGVIFPIKFNKMMNFAEPLASGVSVGPSGNFRGGRQEMVGACFCSGIWNYFGPWLDVQNGYMGFEFNIKGSAHFGWARFSVNATGSEVTLTGYAYETISLKPIVTGETGSDDDDDTAVEQAPSAAPQPQPIGLGRLALGAAARATQ